MLGTGATCCTRSSIITADVATKFNLTINDLFNLSVRDFNTGVTETYRNLTVKESPRRIESYFQSNRHW